MAAQPGLAQDALWLDPHGNSGRQRVKVAFTLACLHVIYDIVKCLLRTIVVVTGAAPSSSLFMIVL